MRTTVEQFQTIISIFLHSNVRLGPGKLNLRLGEVVKDSKVVILKTQTLHLKKVSKSENLLFSSQFLFLGSLNPLQHSCNCPFTTHLLLTFYNPALSNPFIII